jgi:hypothetical protein
MSRENPKEKYLTSVGKAVDYQILKEDAGKNFYSSARDADFTLPDSTADATLVGFSCSVSNPSANPATVTRGGSTDQILYLGGLGNNVTVSNAGDTLEFYCVAQGTWVVMQQPPLIHAGNHATAGTDPISPTAIGAVAENADVQFTADGGLAVKLVAGEALIKGNIVYVKQASGTDGRVWKAPIDSDMPIGAVYDGGVSAGDDVWVTVAGKAQVLPETSITAVRGYVIYCSATTAGKVDQAATVPADPTHFRECGHFLADGSGAGELTLAVLHFN